MIIWHLAVLLLRHDTFGTEIDTSRVSNVKWWKKKDWRISARTNIFKKQKKNGNYVEIMPKKQSRISNVNENPLVARESLLLFCGISAPPTIHNNFPIISNKYRFTQIDCDLLSMGPFVFVSFQLIARYLNGAHFATSTLFRLRHYSNSVKWEQYYFRFELIFHLFQL